MKLIKKTQTYYLLLIAGLLFVLSAAFLVFISSELKESTDDMLARDLKTVIIQLLQEGRVPEAFYNTPTLQIKAIPKVVNGEVIYSNVMLPDPEDGEMETFREIRTQVKLNGQSYKVILRRPQIEYNDLWRSIFVALFIYIIMLVALIAVVNRQFFQHIWKPFYHTLAQLAGYSIKDKGELNLKESDVDEFQALNEEVEKLISRTEYDYQRLKQFTENASHEIQTPLAVIQNQVELLFQDQKLPEDQFLRIAEIKKMTGRLSRLNSALLLLTKIENEQYKQREEIDISQLLAPLVAQYRELAKTKEITVTENLETGVTVIANTDLAEMLLRNLLSNAVKHNFSGGSVTVSLQSHCLIISNTGPEPKMDPSQLFNRFSKANTNSNSLGLGLAIVQTIVAANDFAIDYRYEDEKHILKLTFD